MKVVYDTDNPSVLRIYLGLDYMCCIPSYDFKLSWSDEKYNRMALRFGYYTAETADLFDGSEFIKKLQQDGANGAKAASPGKGV